MEPPPDEYEINLDSLSLAPSRGIDQSLPPADEGKEAWLFLTAAFFVEALVWGFPFSFGIFQEYYSSHEPFASEPSGIAAIGTTAMGIMYLGSPITFVVLESWPSFKRKSPTIGLVIMTAALVGSSFANKVLQLIVTQGVVYAIGGSLLYLPIILFLDEWFIRRKGMAFGVMWAGTGFVGTTVPYIFSWVLSNHSFRTLLRAWAVTLFVAIGPFLFYLKPRIPSSQSSAVKRFDLSFMRSRKYILLELGAILEGLGFFIPGIYLPTYARSLDMPESVSTATLTVLNGSAVLGCIFMGVLIDRFHVTTVIMISTVGAVFAVFVFWGLAINIPVLLVFAATYGFFAGSYTSSWSGIIKEMRKDYENANTGMIFGFLAFGRGIGSIACGPLSQAMLQDSKWKDAAMAYGSGYGELIVFTGVTALLGGVTFGARRLGYF